MKKLLYFLFILLLSFYAPQCHAQEKELGNMSSDQIVESFMKFLQTTTLTEKTRAVIDKTAEFKHTLNNTLKNTQIEIVIADSQNHIVDSLINLQKYNLVFCGLNECSASRTSIEVFSVHHKELQLLFEATPNKLVKNAVSKFQNYLNFAQCITQMKEHTVNLIILRPEYASDVLSYAKNKHLAVVFQNTTAEKIFVYTKIE